MPKKSHRFELIIITLFAILLLIVICYKSIQPSNDRVWSKDQEALSSAEFNGDLVTIYNIRNNTYRSTTDYDVHHYDQTYNLSELETVWFVMEPFNDEWEGLAHTFLTFGFKDSTYLAISVEIRKEQGETYSPWKGMFRQYELYYVVADEQDVIKLRSDFRNDPVFLYPIDASNQTARMIFEDMLQRVNTLKGNPEFYNTFTNTCTTNIARHVNNINPGVIPFSFKVVFPGYADKLAYDLGMIKTNTTFEETRARYQINEKAQEYADDPEWSMKIREQSNENSLRGAIPP